MSEPIYTKQCTKCKEIKPLSEFYKDKNRKDGLYPQCKQCEKERGRKKYNNSKEKIQYNRNINKDKIRISNRLRYIKNSEKIKYDARIYRNSPALYTPYAHQLTIEESPRLAEDGVSLECLCKYCGDYHKPTNSDVLGRIKALHGRKDRTSSNNLYCSESCKQSCGTYNQKKYPKGFNEDNTSREVQPELRKLVLARDNYQCQKCGKGKDETELHCHHSEGVEINPIESADMDICFILCKKCHNDLHTESWCSMRRQDCLV